MGRKKVVAAEGGVVEEENSQVISTLKRMFEELKTSLRTEVNELKKSVDFMSDKFDNLREELEHTRHELNSTQEEMKILARENEDLRQQMNDLQQYTRRDNVMIFGAPEIEQQSTYEVLEEISETIGGSEFVQDVSIAHRLPARPGKTRPIVVRFTKRRSRDEWLHRFRNEAKKDVNGPGIDTTKVNRNFPAGRITAGDQLTVTTRDLLNRTWDAARQKNFKFVWTKDGKIFARKDESSPVHKITTLQDVNNL